MESRVRLGQVKDLEQLAPLWGEMVEYHRTLPGQQWPVRTTEQAWSQRRQQYRDWLTDGSGLLLLAHGEELTQPLGYAMCRLHISGAMYDLGDVFADIEDLVVLHTAQDRGVGTTLLRACREELHNRGITYWSLKVAEANKAAMGLYGNLGFEPWNRRLLARIDHTR